MRFHNPDRRDVLTALLAVAFAAGGSLVQGLALPPAYSLKAEQSVLGALLLDNTAWNSIANIIGDVDFRLAIHRQIFRHISALIKENKPADILTVAESLARDGRLRDVGGLDYIASLAINTPSAANIHRHAKIVRNDAGR